MNPSPAAPFKDAPSSGLLAALLALLAATLASAAAPTPQSLFDGRTLHGWEGNPQFWQVEDGAITGTISAGQPLAKNEFIYWQGEVADFELNAEFRLSGNLSANSGIQFRSQRFPDGHAAGYQADMDQGDLWLGRIYDEHGRALLVERGAHVAIAPDGRRWTEKFGEPASYRTLPKPPGEWNTYRIIASGPHLEVWINGQRVAVLDDHQSDAARYAGVLALQLHSGAGPVKVQFRNLQLTPLGQTTLPPPLPVTATRAAPPEKSIGVTRKNGDPPLRRTAAVDDLARLATSPILWHLRDNPASPSKVTNPSAQKLVAGMKLVAGFQAELIAAEPDLHQPIAFAFDDRGRIWVAEAMSYPAKQPEGKGKDRILIFEDTRGDGSFATKKLFAEGLNLVSGLEVGFGGVFVGAAPHLLFIPDKNRDDIPDGPPQVLLDGWGFQDTHETLNSFTWGPDGWLYGCHGVFTHSLVGSPGTPAADRTKVRAAVWRYHPIRHDFEVFAHGGSNQWGLDFNDVGHLFITHCRSFHGGGGTTYVLRHGQYWNQANNDYAPSISNRGPDFAPDLKNFLLASARYDSGEGGAGKPGTTAIYGGHSHVGTMIYLGDNWPAIYRDHLFTHNLHGHQINHQINIRTGAAYETFHAGYDLSFVPDPTYLPVDLQYGPDGAVYTIDWSDTQHCHNPNSELWDRSNGRLYRVSWAATYQPKQVNLGAMTDAQLAALHTHRNEWFVRVARRILQERAATRTLDIAALASLRTQTDSLDIPLLLRALWTLHATNQLEPQRLQRALAHSSEIVRGWAIQLGTERASALAISPDILTQLATSDPSPLVRLAVASAVPMLPLSSRWPVTNALAQHAEDARDRFLPKMIWFAMAPTVATHLPRALDLAARTPLPSLADSLHWFVARTAEGREQISARLATLPEIAATRILRIIAFSLEGETGLTMPASWATVAARFASTTDSPTRAAVEQLSALFGDKTVLGPVRARLADASSPVADRRRALDLLRRAGDNASTPLLIKLLEDTQLRSAVIPLLAYATDAEATAAANALVTHFAALNAADRTAALTALTSKPTLALPLLRAVEAGTFSRQALTALYARQLRNLRHDEVTRTLERVWGRTNDSSASTQTTIAKFRSSFREAPLWSYEAKAGQAVFERLCASCHALDPNAATGKLGPNLNGTWRNGLDYFLENIIDPNAVVGTDFQLNLVTQRDGTVIAGMIEKESATALIVRTMSETVTIPRTAIKSREVTPQSIMPAGLLEALPPREAIELLLFLTTEPK